MMKQHNALETLLRPPVELWSAAVAFGIALVAAIAPWALLMPPRLGLICAAMAAAFALHRARQGLLVLRYQAGLKFYKTTRLSPHKLPASTDSLYLGEGFEWTQVHTQRKLDATMPEARPYAFPSPRQVALRKWSATLKQRLLRVRRGAMRPIAIAACAAIGCEVWWNPIKPFDDLGGTAILHGVGLNETQVRLRQSERPGHLLVLGTTRVGKTRLLEVLATQDIHAGHVVIIIDPKGDAELMMRVYAEAARAGRLKDLYLFHLGYTDISARYNGIANFSRITEVATRATNPLPSAGNSAAFKEFSWRFTNIVAQAQVALGRVPTYESLLRDITGIDPLFLDYAELALDREESAGRVKGWRDTRDGLEAEVGSKDGKKSLPRALADRPSRLAATVLLIKELQISDPVLAGLSTAVSYERSFFEKIIASLGPFLEKLTTGEIGKLISPNYFDPDDKRPVFDWTQVIRQGGIVYVGLDALSDSVVASAVGNSMLADLVSVGGKLYKYGLDPHRPDGKIVLPVICAHFDEVNEIAGPEFVPMVNKLGGSGFRITAYSQAIQDIEARVGDRAKAEQILANFNHVIMLRVRSQATAKFFADQLEEVTVRTMTAVSGVTDNAGDQPGVDFISNNQDRIGTASMPLISAADLMRQPKGQAFVLIDGNRLHHIRIPFPDAANDAFVPESLKAVAREMKAKYRTSESWWKDGDWLEHQPIGGERSAVAMDVARREAA